MIVAAGLIFGAVGGCSSSPLESPTGADAGSPRLDGALVDPPPEGGGSLDAGVGITPNCERYCGLVMGNCTGSNAQYASKDECLAFCAYLPPVQPSGDVEEKHTASLACRQYWANSPARTDP